MKRAIALSIVLLALASTIYVPTAKAATFTVRLGYTVQSGWLCYGWHTSPTYVMMHCTQHWAYVNGRYVSYNPAWVPSQGTATRTVAATTRSTTASAPTGGSVQTLINQIFGSYAWAATRVAMCESSLNPYAYNPYDPGGSRGVFQFLPTTWAETPYHAYSPFNAWANVSAAHWLFVRDGYSWREWSCKP